MVAARRTEKVLDQLAEELALGREQVVELGLRALLERKLREIQSEILRLHGKYDVSSVTQMEERYRQGALEEEDSWRDLQLLDHLEYKSERLEKLLRELA